MIEKLELKDLDEIMDIWLKTNISAHSFIDSNYWKSNFDMVKKMMQESEIYVYKENNEIYGFVGLMNDYIAGIFVSERYQSYGVGKKLLDYIKSRKNVLTLSVYKNNKRAVKFYTREKFTVVKEGIDDSNDEKELTMEWKK
ncbi:MAG: GNAT family N-acetyltransferase [Peptostreptococcus sp.]|uniref:GNAT family N-acetyltransferase n=1 Tax=Peptostreptococcus sp. TaxID=1262 RepID=UPI002FC88105